MPCRRLLSASWQKTEHDEHHGSSYGDIPVKPGKPGLLLLPGSIVLSAVFFLAGLAVFFLFLVIPLIPFLSGSKKIRRCPVWGWETSGSERFGPCDATPPGTESVIRSETWYKSDPGVIVPPVLPGPLPCSAACSRIKGNPAPAG